MSTHVSTQLILTEDELAILFGGVDAAITADCYHEQLYLQATSTFDAAYRAYFDGHFGSSYALTLSVHRHEAFPSKEDRADFAPFACGTPAEHVIIGNLSTQVPSRSDRSEPVLQAKGEALSQLAWNFLGREGKTLGAYWG